MLKTQNISSYLETSIVIIESNFFGQLLNIALRLYMYFYMVMSHFLAKQIKSSLKLFTRTYRIAKDFEHLPGEDTSIIQLN